MNFFRLQSIENRRTNVVLYKERIQKKNSFESLKRTIGGCPIFKYVCVCMSMAKKYTGLDYQRWKEAQTRKRAKGSMQGIYSKRSFRRNITQRGSALIVITIMNLNVRDIRCIENVRSSKRYWHIVYLYYTLPPFFFSLFLSFSYLSIWVYANFILTICDLYPISFFFAWFLRWERERVRRIHALLHRRELILWEFYTLEDNICYTFIIRPKIL